MENQTSKLVIVAIIFLLIGGIAGYAVKANKAGQNQMPAGQSTDMQSATPAAGISDKQVSLRQDMRKLWTDHVVWTREYIIAAVGGTPDAPAAATRLLQNQVDIGNAVAVYYGKDAGDKLTALLKQHILTAVDLINDAKANDQAKFKTDNAKWQQNGQDIADFLSSANPSNWPQQTMRDMMTKHLATTAEELTDRLNKNYDADVKAFDAVYDHILMMSDAISSGIIKQFPDKF